MKKILLFIPLVVLLSCDDGGIAPSETFVKYFGATDASYELKDMVLRVSGEEGLVLLGERTSSTNVSNERSLELKRFFLVSTDENGNSTNEDGVVLPFFNRTGNEIPFDVEASRITAVEGGGYLVIGTRDIRSIDSTNTDLVKLIVWTQLNNNLGMDGQWMAAGDTISNYHGVDINVTSDGGVLIAGYTDVNGDNDFFYSKVGGTSTEWTRIQTRLNSDDQLIRALPTSGGFGLFGRTDALSEDGETGINVERTIIDQDGVIINSLIYGTTVGNASNYDDIPMDVIEKPGGFAIVGESSRGGTISPFILNVDLTGAATAEVNFTIQFALIEPGVVGRATSVTQTLSNDFIIVGELQSYTANFDKDNPVFRNNEAMVMRTDQVGSRIGELKNFGVENGDDIAVRVLTTPDGSILVGANYDFGGGLTQIVLLKMNVNGELKR